MAVFPSVWDVRNPFTVWNFSIYAECDCLQGATPASVWSWGGTDWKQHKGGGQGQPGDWLLLPGSSDAFMAPGFQTSLTLET